MFELHVTLACIPILLATFFFRVIPTIYRKYYRTSQLTLYWPLLYITPPLPACIVHDCREGRGTV